MKHKPENILARIAYAGPLEQNLEAVAAIQRAFLDAVPFENLDIHRNVPITLATDRIIDKIVARNRGGFCYECNTVLYELLTALGYRVDRISARMALGPEPGAEFDHLALVVTLDREYLVDVGNGQSADQPLSLDGGEAIRAEGIDYRVGEHAEGMALFYKPENEDWQPRFLFTRKPRELHEYAGMCEHHQHSPESIFTQGKLCTLPTPEGRVTYTGKQLTITKDGETVLTRDLNDSEEAEILAQYFGIHL